MPSATKREQVAVTQTCHVHQGRSNSQLQDSTPLTVYATCKPVALCTVQSICLPQTIHCGMHTQRPSCSRASSVSCSLRAYCMLVPDISRYCPVESVQDSSSVSPGVTSTSGPVMLHSSYPPVYEPVGSEAEWQRSALLTRKFYAVNPPGCVAGDGAGVGKGRQIAGVILDNYARGRRSASLSRLHIRQSMTWVGRTHSCAAVQAVA